MFGSNKKNSNLRFESFLKTWSDWLVVIDESEENVVKEYVPWSTTKQYEVHK